MKHWLLILFFATGFSIFAFSQKQVRKDIREGNKEYKQGKMTDAELDYRKALEGNARSIEAAYNLGNTLYKQGKMQEAFEQYQTVLNNESDKNKLSMAWHNMGNILMAAKDYGKSINAYKNALRNNPKDDETRYNLALAQKLWEDQQQQQQNQNQDQKQDEQQQKEQEQQQKEQEQKEQEQKEQEQQQKEQEQQQNKNEMSKQNADQILDAMMQDEKNTQDRVKMEQMKRQKQKQGTSKNW
ncbi:MAG: tetratricopeptide repeat protein [Dysgonamonadaceae bacterium]|jgi:tetratricopeptide (TPR) repeat protein|nr:tetratricopeptide repeat protein [Dysgonamonadaceae bacterium]